MQRLVTFCIFIWILYLIINNRQITLPHALYNTSKEKQTNNNKTKTEDQANSNSSIAPREKAKESTNDEMVLAAEQKLIAQPQSTVERIITNSLSSALSTKEGLGLAQKIIGNNSDIIIPGEVAISTNNSVSAKAKYSPQIGEELPNGKKTICGQKITIEYSQYHKGQKSETKNLTYTIGESISKDLNIIPLGLTQFQPIIINISPQALLDSKNNAGVIKSITYRLEVMQHLTEHEIDTEEVRIFDSYLNPKSWVVCGDNIKFSYKIKNINGSEIKKDELTIDVGTKDYPEILSYILPFAPYQGTRVVLMPKKYLKTSKHPILHIGNDEEYVLFEIDNIYLTPKPFKNEIKAK
ncbi:MAG: hypothetical protein SFT91_02570 [Rickettsiaceae bacterium]|nr:hypothetical protein [Rickettsiaceae bacterium]